MHLPQIVYEFHDIVLPRNLPAVKPPGPGGKPGKSIHPEKPPARGSTAFHRKATVISNPPHPDNNFQTIIQPRVPAAQKIRINLRLPNIVMGGSLTVPAPAPKIPTPPMKLSLPKTLNSLNIPQTSVVSLKAPKLQLPASSQPNLPPIPVPPPPAPPKPQPKAKPAKVVVATLGVKAISSGSGAQLLSLSLNPAPPTKKLSIPAGNRYGAFTISPSGKHPGSPNGTAGGSSAGGDASTGVGWGHEGGGGGGAGTGKLAVSSSGNAVSGGTGNGGRLSASYLAKLVYPILRPPPKNRFAMVITAGPVGGGGLHIFGVLKGGKVYTVFLPMPVKNWILQYCALNKHGSHKDPKSTRVRVQLNFGLVAPAVEKRFDFHRPTLRPDQKKRMIVLHGIIGTDGSVHDLTVYRGVENVANQAAVAAFSKWKFQPALHNGKPIPVEILLGIPLS
ncbi:MAG: energy transducer TonB [Acidobacteriota bacterium]